MRFLMGIGLTLAKSVVAIVGGGDGSIDTSLDEQSGLNFLMGWL